jgi:hypothetical protein
MEIIQDTFEEYLSKKDHVSASDVKTFMKCPLNYYHEKFINKSSGEEKDHLLLGSAMHEAILEPENFFKNYFVAENFDKRTKKGKEEYQQFLEQNKGRKAISQEQMEIIKNIAKNAVDNRTLMSLIENSYREVSIYSIDETTGLKIRIRPDILCSKYSTIVDLKSCMSASPKDFLSSVYKFGYAISDAFYKNFSKRENYIFCAMEKQSPYQVCLYELKPEHSEYGFKMYRRGLDLMKWSYDNNYWCNYNEFETLKECYDTNSLDEFFEIIKTAPQISFI